MKASKCLLAVILTLSSFSLLAQEKVRAEKLFIVHDKTSKISRVEVRKDVKGAQNVIQIDATNASGGANMASRSMALASAEITGINIITGSFNMTREISKTSRGMSMQLLDVVFPCRVRISITDQFLDVEIKEAGFWKVTVALIN
jgi:hypothetical protein